MLYLLRECKRYTACRVASTPFVVLAGGGGPHPRTGEGGKNPRGVRHPGLPSSPPPPRGVTNMRALMTPKARHNFNQKCQFGPLKT